MIPATDYLRLVAIEPKFERNEPLNAEDMEVYLRYPNFYKPRPVELCGCGCGKPMSSPSEQYKIRGAYVRSDCWYDQMGDEIEQHPIIPRGIRRRA